MLRAGGSSNAASSGSRVAGGGCLAAPLVVGRGGFKSGLARVSDVHMPSNAFKSSGIPISESIIIGKGRDAAYSATRSGLPMSRGRGTGMSTRSGGKAGGGMGFW